jgi:restriction endonuclease Mrr
LDDDIRKLLGLENFLGGMSVSDFIEELSKDHFLKGAEVNKLEYLDPKPYIRTFESTLRELKKLSVEANDQQNYHERESDKFDLKHSHNIMNLSSRIDDTNEKFEGLDVKISLVTSRLNPLGDSLNRITNSRDRSMVTIFLIRAYHGFYTKEKYEPLESLRVSKKYDDKIKCAQTVAKLLILSKKIEAPELSRTTKTVEVIQKFAETMETQLLRKFEVASEDNNFDMMKEIAAILYEFNGGTSVVQSFINNNDILIGETGEEDNNNIIDNEALWVKLSDPNYVEAVRDDGTQMLLDRLKVAIKGQTRIVLQVFQEPIGVLKTFIQRVYAQIIQTRINAILQYSLSIGTLAHVRVLHALHIMVGDFSKDMKEFLMTNEFDKENELVTILNQSFYDLFVEYTYDSVYFVREKKNLENLIYSYVHKFNSFHEKPLSNGFLTDKLTQMENAEFKSAVAEHQSMERRRLNQFKSYVNSMKARLPATSRNSDDDNTRDPDFKEYGKLNLSTVETILKSSVESIARMLELCPNKSPEFSLEILEIVLFDFGKLYVGGALEVCYDQVKYDNTFSKTNSTGEINLEYTSIFPEVSDILYLISSCIKKIILPCALNSPNIKNRMTNLTNAYIKRCEASLNIILNETLDMISTRIAYLLSKQKKKDFLTDVIGEDTEACESVSEFLDNIHLQLRHSLNSTNLNSVLIKIGMNLLNQLLEHYKKFVVDSTGGIVLTKDVIRYQSSIDKWHIEELSENFLLLKEIANLFTVQADLINSLVTEGQLAQLKPYTIKQYVSKRGDFNSSYIDRFFSIKG